MERTRQQLVKYTRQSNTTINQRTNNTTHYYYFLLVNYINYVFGGAGEVVRLQDSQQWRCDHGTQI
jgi:hypothetical protein